MDDDNQPRPHCVVMPVEGRPNQPLVIELTDDEYGMVQDYATATGQEVVEACIQLLTDGIRRLREEGVL